MLARHIERPTRLVARNLSALLAMFYCRRDTPYDAVIALQVRPIGMRMQCHGTELQEVRCAAEKRTYLTRYQAEMRAFAAFLAAYDSVQPTW